MSFEEFKDQALLYVIDALDASELREFEQARQAFGEKAEDYLDHARKLISALSLHLSPQKPSPEVRVKLLEKIHRLIDNDGG